MLIDLNNDYSSKSKLFLIYNMSGKVVNPPPHFITIIFFLNYTEYLHNLYK